MEIYYITDTIACLSTRQLFSSEPCRPGYALYRLDSKSPAGLYEWLNCAYRPESAKVREKMQYTLTQTSLLKGLSEQHFLETVYVSLNLWLSVLERQSLYLHANGVFR